MGTVLIVYVIYNLINEEIKLKLGKFARFLIGIIAGFFGAPFNINGPLIGLYSLSKGTFSKDENKDLVATYMAITGFFIAAGHIFSGRITTSIFTYILFAIPFLFLGLWLGTKLHKKISLNWIKWIIYFFVYFAGIKFILT